MHGDHSREVDATGRRRDEEWIEATAAITVTTAPAKKDKRTQTYILIGIVRNVGTGIPARTEQILALVLAYLRELDPPGTIG